MVLNVLVIKFMLDRIKNNLYYYYLLFLAIAMPLIPKDFSTLFGVIPVRLLLLGILVLIYLYDLVIRRVKMAKPPKIFIFFYGLMLIWMIFGFFNAIDKMLFIYTYLKFLMFGLCVYVISTYTISSKKINTIFETLFASSVIVSIIGIINYIVKTNLNYNGIYKYTGAEGRIMSTFFNPIYLGIFLLLILLLLLYKIGMETNKKIIIRYYIYIIINSVALLLTFTRTVAVLFLASVFLFVIIELFFNSNIKYNMVKYISIFLLLVITIFLIPGAKYLYSSTIVSILPANASYKLLNFTNKYLYTGFDLNLYGFKEVQQTEKIESKPQVDNPNNTSSKPENENKPTNNNSDPKKEPKTEIVIDKKFEDASVNSRDMFKLSAKKVINDNSTFGVGLGNYEKYVLNNKAKYVTKKFGYPHNSFLHLMAESGRPTGIILFILIIGMVIYSFIEAVLRKSKFMATLFIMWINILALSIYESLFYDTQLCPLLLIITILIIMQYNQGKTNKNVMFISSVGGHLTQLLELKSLFSKYDYILITEKNSVTKPLKEKYNMCYLLYGSRQYLFKYIFISIFNIVKSFLILVREDSNIIITTGTHTAVPMCYLGWLFNKKVIYIESFAKRTSPTLSGRLVYPVATKFVVQWESMQKFYPKAECWGWIY